MRRPLEKLVLAFGCIAALSLTSAPTEAHHSFAMFDNDRMITIEGTVKELQWTNPHIWVQVMVTDPATGEEVEWSIEGGSPGALLRHGWSRKALPPGTRVEIDTHPLKDGRPGGSLVEVRIDGKKVGY